MPRRRSRCILAHTAKKLEEERNRSCEMSEFKKCLSHLKLFIWNVFHLEMMNTRTNTKSVKHGLCSMMCLSIFHKALGSLVAYGCSYPTTCKWCCYNWIRYMMIPAEPLCAWIKMSLIWVNMLHEGNIATGMHLLHCN